jgi:hypothetical protein
MRTSARGLLASWGFLVAVLARALWAYPVDMDKLPNQGRNSFGCIVCHLSPAGEEINAFGRDYRDNDHRYDGKLQAMDSDGDGFTNDEELRATPPSNPGDGRVFPWVPPDPWAWGASLLALVVLATGAFAFAVRERDRSS